jgi:hypothetical protein
VKNPALQISIHFLQLNLHREHSGGCRKNEKSRFFNRYAEQKNGAEDWI